SIAYTFMLSPPPDFRRYAAFLDHNERCDHLHPHRVGPGCDAGFGHAWVAQERRLDFDRSDPVAGDLDDLVGTSAEPDITIIVERRCVAGEVQRLSRDPSPVIVCVAL